MSGGGRPFAARPMVLPPCPMAEFVVPRHSAVMERLRRRIELCRRHHSACESRYQAVSPERLELERQQTFALHQRCLQAKAKRAGKHRQPPPAPPPPAPPPPAAAAGSAERSGANGLDGDTASGEQQHGRSSALIAVSLAWGRVLGPGMDRRSCPAGTGTSRLELDGGRKKGSRGWLWWPAVLELGSGLFCKVPCLLGYNFAADKGCFVFSRHLCTAGRVYKNCGMGW